MLAPVSYLRSLVVRAVHRHRTGVGWIPAGGPIVDEYWFEFRHVYNSHSILRHINPIENLSTSNEVPQNLKKYFKCC